MLTIQLRYLPLREIEEAIVEIWRCVEEYRMPSPDLRFDFQGETTASVALHVEDRVLFAILSARLSNWIVTSGRSFSYAPAVSAYRTCSEIFVSATIQDLGEKRTQLEIPDDVIGE